jgi:hypothetical protein
MTIVSTLERSIGPYPGGECGVSIGLWQGEKPSFNITSNPHELECIGISPCVDGCGPLVNMGPPDSPKAR